MNRIQKKFKELQRRRQKALIVFITAGDPNLKKTEALIHAFEKEGVDLVELGVPFSDPLADGPVIQAASNRSLKKHTTLKTIIQMVRRVRKTSQVPLVLMSYLNPVLALGAPSFIKTAKEAGVDGLIVPDLPPDEEKNFRLSMRRHSMDLVYLLAPTSTEKRRRMIAKASKGFIYYVSLTGVTGSARAALANVKQNIASIKKTALLPVCVGFGISNAAEARQMSKIADGVIVGSAIVKALAEHSHLSAESFTKKFVKPFAKAVHA